MSTINFARGLLQRVFAGKVIAPFRRSDILKVSRLNELVDCINPFMSMEVRRGESDNFILTPNKAIIQLFDSAAAGGSGGMRFQGLYSSIVNYYPNDVVYTAPDTNTRIVWIALIENGPATTAGAKTPTFPEPGTIYWRCLAMFKSGGLNYRGIYDGAKDYLVNDLVYTEDTVLSIPIRKPWVCEIINGPGSAVHAPTWPEPGTVYWRNLATYGDLTPQWHYFQDVNNSCANMKMLYLGHAPQAA